MVVNLLKDLCIYPDLHLEMIHSDPPPTFTMLNVTVHPTLFPLSQAKPLCSWRKAAVMLDHFVLLQFCN